MYAPYSLVRPALENASAAVWILHPGSRPERVARRLRLASLDIRNGEYVRRLAKKAGPRTELERLTEVRDIAARAGVDSAEAVRKVGYGEIVKAASEVLAPVSDAVPVAWRVCSGIIEHIEIDAGAPPKSPRTTDKKHLRGALEGAAEGGIRLHIDNPLVGQDRAACTITCEMPDGKRLVSNTIYDLEDGKIVRQLDVQVMDPD